MVDRNRSEIWQGDNAFNLLYGLVSLFHFFLFKSKINVLDVISKRDAVRLTGSFHTFEKRSSATWIFLKTSHWLL